MDAKLPKLASDKDEVEIDAESLENLAAPTKREETVINKEYFCLFAFLITK